MCGWVLCGSLDPRQVLEAAAAAGPAICALAAPPDSSSSSSRYVRGSSSFGGGSGGWSARSGLGLRDAEAVGLAGALDVAIGRLIDRAAKVYTTTHTRHAHARTHTSERDPTLQSSMTPPLPRF